ncbi:uncharacterized protein GGS22DRAFT_192183 [Annulohypoxylon maeteangense]|uniref:uncharacterized protein n=1 Tax=Annulohypoxylon maeteangense TaxID=1927788 RepID=UPI0020073461|nr:uncharacterized protein GGS22DRAFT_192183 [Annulohypoxylon maeteangense]KAI0881549.1 hypothetical protein GGS22DRAFT_192183 [Annulohypoxylon maeteangense]
MCSYWEICTYNCGHEEVAPNPIESSFCLFRTPGICTRELGRFRILETHVNNWCPQCNAISAFNKHKQPARGTYIATPCAQPDELSRQRAVRSKLVGTQFMPGRVPTQMRLRQLNAIANRALQSQMKRGDSFAAPVLAWVLRYIASLPPWMDRPGLARELRPWLAPLLDEEHQTCVRPALRTMECEDYLDDVMVWTRSF